MRYSREDLVAKAKEASGNAYAPYSKFQVGAAVLTDTGQIFTGCNVENASFGLTICAERIAIFNAIAHLGPGVKIAGVAVYVPADNISTPCGACRQVISEFALNTEIICACDSPEVTTFGLEDLFPYSFRFKQKK